MPQFHETMYGKRFFDGQLPRLIKALQEIATNLEKQLDIPVEDAEAPGDNYEKLTIERLKEMYPILEGLGNKDISEVSIYLNLIADAHLRMATNPANTAYLANTAYHVEQLGKCNQWMLQIRDIINNPWDERGTNTTKYCRKSIVVEVEAYRPGMEDGFDLVEEIQPLGDGIRGVKKTKVSKPYINSPRGKLYISPGDYIITDAEGEIYPCNPDVFKETHKPVEE